MRVSLVFFSTVVVSIFTVFGLKTSEYISDFDNLNCLGFFGRPNVIFRAKIDFENILWNSLNLYDYLWSKWVAHL